MTTVKIEINREGVRALLTGPEAQADMVRRARRIAAAAGEGNEAQDDGPGKNRARAVVVTATPEARAAEARTRALTRAVDAGRD
jgi:hypothetical protein